MDVPRDLLDERWPDEPAPEPTDERWSAPPPRPRPALVVNRWGDTAEDQRRRRRELVHAMRGT